MTEQIKLIAKRIIELREISDLTKEQMAKELNLNIKIYTAYENAEVDFPVSILYAIAVKLGVDLTEILTGDSPKMRSGCLVRKGEGIEIQRFKGYNFESLGYKFINRQMEPMIVSVGERTETSPPDLVSHLGQEFNYVLEGTLKIILGKHEYILNPGDSFYFDPTIPHAQCALGGKESKFLTVIQL